MTHAALLSEIDRFIAATEMAETYFGRLAVNDSKLIRRLRSGRPIETKTVEKITSFMTVERQRREKALRARLALLSSEAAA